MRHTAYQQTRQIEVAHSLSLPTKTLAGSMLTVAAIPQPHIAGIKTIYIKTPTICGKIASRHILR